MALNVQSTHLESTTGSNVLAEVGKERLRRLCAAVGLGEQTERALAIFTLLAEAADGNSAISAPQIEDGLAPFELCVVSGPLAEVRIAVDVAGGANEIAGLLERLAPSNELDGSRFRQIQDLFFPESPRGAFAARISASFGAGRGQRFEMYLDPGVAGRALAPLLVERTLLRLGFSSGWPAVGNQLTGRGPDTDELKYVAIDLSSPQPRFKVYARHRSSSAAVLDQAARAGLSYQPKDVPKFLGALRVESDHLDGLAPLTCYEFSHGSGTRPNSVSTEFPICGYAKHDGIIEQSVLACLAHFGIGQDNYAHALAAMADGAPEDGIGLQSYIAFQRDAQGLPTIAVRFPIRAAHRGAVASPDAVAPVSGAMQVVDRYEQWDQITNHPFLHRLRSEPVNLRHIWYVLANFQASISKTFSQRLALIASRVDDPHTRFIVTSLLYDEMGSGNYDLAHVNLFANMMKVMDPWKPTIVDGRALRAGHRFNLAMDNTYGNPDINVALGAIVSGEIFGKQFDQFLGEEIRRQNEVDPALFVWVTLHESLEVTHAGEGADIARLVPPDEVEAMSQGAYGLALGAWQFLTDVYEICYSERPAG